jgi:hypothetical protein
MSIRCAVMAVLALTLASISSARAEGLAIRGIIKGTDGKPLAGAEVRAQRLDGRGSAVIATTDAKGEYSFRGLALAPYKVTAVVNRVPKSVASIKTRAASWVRVDFDLAATAGKVAKHKRMVYVSGDTGSHIGGGRWIEVDDPNSTTTGPSSVERLDGGILKNPNALNPAAGASGPSH